MHVCVCDIVCLYIHAKSLVAVIRSGCKQDTGDL